MQAAHTSEKLVWENAHHPLKLNWLCAMPLQISTLEHVFGTAHRMLRILHMHLNEMFELRSGVKISHFTPKYLHACTDYGTRHIFTAASILIVMTPMAWCIHLRNRCGRDSLCGRCAAKGGSGALGGTPQGKEKVNDSRHKSEGLNLVQDKGEGPGHRRQQRHAHPDDPHCLRAKPVVVTCAESWQAK